MCRQAGSIINIDKLITIARQSVGIPFKEHGRDINVGLDCYGLIVYIYKQLGVELLDYEYDPDWSERGLNIIIENYHNEFKQVGRGDIKAGDIGLFYGEGNLLNHTGIMLDRDQFIHASRKAGTIVSRLSRQPWNRKSHSFYRINKS